MSNSKRQGYSRRKILIIGGSGLLSATLPFSRANAQSGEQRDWRFCDKCKQLFFDGYPDKGRCPAGGGHSAIGFNFSIEYNARRTQELPGRQRQYDWRYCNKCHTMFYDGYPNKGVCPSGGGHAAAGYIFGLWDVNGPSFPTSKMQENWRFCNKCQALFYDGYSDKGRCSVGGGHVAQGLNFKLFYGDSSSGNPPPRNPPPKNPPPSSPPVISVELILIPGSFNQLRVSGGLFSAGEQVNISVITLINGQNQSTVTTPTTADLSRRINQTIGVTCPFGIISVFQVQARGVSSGRVSNTSGASC